MFEVRIIFTTIIYPFLFPHDGACAVINGILKGLDPLADSKGRAFGGVLRCGPP